MVKAKEVLEPLAKCYISRVAEKNMEMKLLFFTAQEGNEPSEDVRKFARLTQPAPLLVIVDMAHKQVRKLINNHSKTGPKTGTMYTFEPKINKRNT